MARTFYFLKPYRRITSTGQFIAEIDGLRFIAIFMVYIFHLQESILRYSPAGYIRSLQSDRLLSVTRIMDVGVPLFFVISGFILGLPFAKANRNLVHPVSLKKYFWRRVTRLEPPYFLCLSMFFCLKVAAHKGSVATLLPNLIASVFYVHNAIFHKPSIIEPVAWSLEVEVQFYLLAPVLALVFAIRSPLIRRASLAAMVLLCTNLSSIAWRHEPLQMSLLAFAQYFFAGFLLVEYYLSRREHPAKGWPWDLVSLGGWPLMLALLVRGGDLTHWAMPWLIVLLYIAAFRGLATNHAITNIWITTIGGMCYSIYLLHGYLIAAVTTVTHEVGSTDAFSVRLFTQFLLISPIVLVLCALYFRIIERPCMRPDWPQQVRAAIRRISRPAA